MRRNLFLVLAVTLFVAACGPVYEPPCHEPVVERHCGSTDEPCCLSPNGAPAGQLIASCTPGLLCTVVAGTDTTMSYCRYVGP